MLVVISAMVSAGGMARDLLWCGEQGDDTAIVPRRGILLSCCGRFGSFFFRYSCSALIFIASALCPNPPPPRAALPALSVLELEPVPRAAANVRRAQTLRHDPLAAELAGVAVDDITAVIEVLDERSPGPQERSRLTSVALRLVGPVIPGVVLGIRQQQATRPGHEPWVNSRVGSTFRLEKNSNKIVSNKQEGKP